MQRQRLLLALIVALVIAAIVTLAQIPLKLGLDLRGGAQLTLRVQTTEQVEQINDRQLQAVRRVIQNRVNGLGVSKAEVQTSGEDKIIVQLPGVSDPSQAERVLGETAQLAFRQQQPGTQQQFQSLFARQQQRKQSLERLRQADKPDAESIAQKQDDLGQLNQQLRQLFGPPQLTGEQLDGAQAQPTQGGNSWEVALDFTGEGGRQFAQLTQELAGTGRTIGIFLDDRLLSAPTVAARFAGTGITGGGAVITGDFSTQEARNLAIQLRGGALPLPVEIVSNRTVGATLGQASIRNSLYAAASGLVLVLAFMAVYYRLPGAIADAALGVYALLAVASYALVGVTLTLPGIAGFILSIGMAVDANVLIFERTREELRAGNTLYRSVESGFYRAFSSIIDSNVTTLIACAALFWLGTGFVKGFAVTLAIGVALSLFTALTCTRTLMLLVVLGLPGVRRRPHLFCPQLASS